MRISSLRRLASCAVMAAVALGAAFPARAQMMKRLPPAPTPTPQVSVAQLNPAASCVSNPTPRIGNVNGTQSGIVFQPGSPLNIAGCGFGRNGQAFLSGGGTTVPLKIESWTDSAIRAHVDSTLGGVPDLSGVRVNVKPNGLPVISSIETNGFRAARAQFVLAIPPGAAGITSPIYGAPKIVNTGAYAEVKGPATMSSATGAATSITGSGAPRQAGNQTSAVFTRVSRSLKVPLGFCPAVSDQARQMTDSWPVNFLASGFEVAGVDYKNETNAKTWDTQRVQWVAVGYDGSARYDATQKRLFVTFQGSSVYVKKGGTLETILLPIEIVKDLMDSGSSCTSAYTVSLTVSGPRGFSPFK